MKTSKDPMGDRMKQFESCSNTVLIDGTPKIIRLDGKAFHTWVKKAKCDKPYDIRIMHAMISGAKAVMKEIGGVARLAYIQSDECSIVLNDKIDINTQAWFGNKIQKMASVAASIMSVSFTREWEELAKEYVPAVFDARVFQVPSVTEAHNAILWRQFDSCKNSVSQYARSYFSHKKLEGENSQGMQDMMLLEHDFEWATAPSWTRHGVIVARYEPDDFYYEQGMNTPVIKADGSLQEYWDIPMLNKEPDYIPILFEGGLYEFVGKDI